MKGVVCSVLPPTCRSKIKVINISDVSRFLCEILLYGEIQNTG